MKNLSRYMALSVIFLAAILGVSCCRKDAVSTLEGSCRVGAFIADAPGRPDVEQFKLSYGKRPGFVMVFYDFTALPDRGMIREIYAAGSELIVTWEPWIGSTKEPIDYDGLLAGRYDRYIGEFTDALRSAPGKIYIRFAHEMNGSWYPWSGKRIGADKYIAAYRYVADLTRSLGLTNAEWIFSINWEDVPKTDNDWISYYPGDGYADYIGIDGYNWGSSREWSRWMSFHEIFDMCYNDVITRLRKPVMISEFGTTSRGGDKSAWIIDALKTIKGMKEVKAFVLFNVDKEEDWSFPAFTSYGRALADEISDPYFKE